jgi:hypothetical protein
MVMGTSIKTDFVYPFYNRLINGFVYDFYRKASYCDVVYAHNPRGKYLVRKVINHEFSPSLHIGKPEF